MKTKNLFGVTKSDTPLFYLCRVTIKILDMALFKVTTKRLLLSGGKRLEAGMTAEVSFNGSTLPFANSTVKAEIQRQFKMKYNVDFPVGYINGNEFKVEKL